VVAGGYGAPVRSTGSALRPLVIPVFLPAAVFGLAQGAAIPIIAFAARSLGASFLLTAVVVALPGIGQMLGNLPAGRIVRRFGERRTIIAGSLLGAVGALLSLLAWTVWALGVGVFLVGVANAVWGLARHAFVADAVPAGMRARALSTMAGASRLGVFAGPLIGAGVVHLVGIRGGFAVQLAAVLGATVLMARLPDVERRPAGTGTRGTPILQLVARHRRLLGSLGTAVLLTGMARATRNAAVPLWAAHLGLDASTTSLVIGLAAGLEVVVAYPAGRAMDLYGRRVVAVPCLWLLGVAHVLLPATTGELSLALVTLMMGIGNGLGNGLVMTLGADVAPLEDRAEFLAVWRLSHDSGMAAGPTLVSAVSAFGSPVAGIVAVGGLALVGAGIYARAIPRYVPRL
jgi:MFS family permease